MHTPVRYLFLLLVVFGFCLTLSGCRLTGEPQAPGTTLLAANASNRDRSVSFADVAPAAGLNYRWTVAGKRPLNILQTIGNGCAFLDYDGDGDLDVLLVGPRPALFRGDGRGHFTDVTASAGLSGLSGRFLGCAVGDYDNDGFEDVYLSGYRTGVLLHNEGGKRFTDVTASSGLRAQPWGTSCAWADLDGDGRLDLYVANYVKFGTEPGIPQLCDNSGHMTSCGPRYYTPIKGVFYHNLGSGRFRDVTQAWGFGAVTGRGLGVAVADFDGSGHPGLALANDEIKGDLMQNHGSHVQNIGAASGTAYDGNGNVHGGMGVDWGDYDNDGRLDLVVGTFQHEIKNIYHNEGGGFFVDASAPLGVGQAAQKYLSFGVKWFDFNNDGWLDLLFANGHVQDNIHDIDASTTYRQAPLLLRSEHGATFTDVTPQAGAGLQTPIVGRGLAVGDYDNDGRVDALLVDSEGTPHLWHNECAPVGHWLGVRLQGKGSNRDGYGAVLTARAGGRVLMRSCRSDGSYLSASDARVHFGLGQAARVDQLTIRWPSGRTDTLSNVAADRYMTVVEGQTTGKP